MRRELSNAFKDVEDYNCFACGPDHPFGLHLTFTYDDELETAYSNFVPNKLFEGFPGILHGGIQATILDEVSFWGIWGKHQRTGFTYDLSVKYLKKCPVSSSIEAVGIIGDLKKRLVPVKVMLHDPESKIIFTEGTVHYYIPRIDPRMKKK